MQYIAILVAGAALASISAQAQQDVVIRAETRLVLVDTVVTDKKGSFVRDLKTEEFRLWEDGKEQKILNAALQDPAAPDTKPQYLVLLLDYAGIIASDQLRLRQAVTKFIDSDPRANRMVAVALVSGARTVNMVQSFTSDKQKLQNALTAVGATGSESQQRTTFQNAGAQDRMAGAFAVRPLLLSMNSLAKKLGTLPGRKAIIMFSPGLAVPSGNTDLQAMLNSCNRANVAIYPIDVGGMGFSAQDLGTGLARPSNFKQSSSTVVTQFAAGGQASRGGGQSNDQGGGSVIQNQTNMPRFDRMSTDTPASLRATLGEIAKETGGYLVTGTNDIFGAVDKVRSEQDQYYMLSYSAPSSQDGSCHALKVKVERSGTVVRARSRYCNVKSPDLLAGTPVVRQLEAKMADPPAADAGSVRAPYFYTDANTARVNVAMDLPASAAALLKGKGKVTVNVLGVAYRPDGAVAARFSDAMTIEPGKQKDPRPPHYENQFEMAPGKYTLKLAYNTGSEMVGRLETPLEIDPYDGKQITLAGLALTNDLRPVGKQMPLVEDRVPLVSRGMMMVPSGTNRFKASDNAAVYTEVYDPLLAGPNPPRVGVILRILERKSGQEKMNSGLVIVSGPDSTEGTRVTVGLALPLKDLGPGSYVVEVTGYDSAKTGTRPRQVPLDIE